MGLTAHQRQRGENLSAEALALIGRVEDQVEYHGMKDAVGNGAPKADQSNISMALKGYMPPR